MKMINLKHSELVCLIRVDGMLRFEIGEAAEYYRCLARNNRGALFGDYV
jgi:hypothetical protein